MLEFAFQISVPEQTAFQYYFAVLVLAALLVVTFYLIYTSRYHNLPPENREIKSEVERQLQKKTPSSVRIPARSDPTDYRLPVVQTITGSEPERETVKSGTRKIWSEASEYWTPILGQIPDPILKVWSTATAVAVFGAIAVSTSAVVEIITRESEFPGVDVILNDLQFYTTELITGFKDLIFQFPFLDEIWALAFSFAILISEWLYRNWPVVAGALILVGLALYLFERSELEEPGSVVDSIYVGASAFLGVIAVWIAGVGPLAVFWVIGYAIPQAREVAPVVGLVGSFLTATGIVWWRVRDWYRSFDEFPRERYAYLTTRTLGTSMLWLGWVLVSVYILNATLTGEFARVGEAIVQAPIEKKLIIAVIAGAPVIKTVHEIGDTWTEMRNGVVETASRMKVKTLMFTHALPYLSVAFGYVFVFSLFDSIMVGVLGGIFFGLLVRMIYVGLIRVKTGGQVARPPTETVSSVLIQSYTLDLPDGEKYYVLLDGKHRFAGDSAGDLGSELVDQAVTVSQTGSPDPSIYSRHARHLKKFGISDLDDTRTKVEEHARSKLVSLLRSNAGSVNREQVRRAVDELPEEVVDEKITELVEQGILSRDRETVILERDPWTGITTPK